jgi:cytochrome c5
MMRKTILGVMVVAFAACGGKSKPPQIETAARETTPTPQPTPESQPAPPPVDDGGALAQAALAEQYDAGKKLYVSKACDSCHGEHGEGNPKNPAVIGDKAFPEAPPKGAKLRKTPFKTAADVLAFVKAKMPIKSPGTLTDDEAAAVTAWMLSESKVNITAKLDATNAASVNLR